MAGYDHSLLTAISAALLLSKMINYAKNPHAEVVLKELSAVEPAFLALFCFEELLEVEACCSAVLQILKVYLDKKSLEINIEIILQVLIKNAKTKQFVRDYYYQNQGVQDSSAGLTSSNPSNRNSVRKQSSESSSLYNSSMSSFMKSATSKRIPQRSTTSETRGFSSP